MDVCSNNQFSVENCPTDLAPFDGDGDVNVSDLLAIINNWGSCPAPDTLDQDVQDCMDYATEDLEHEPYTRPWLDADDECVKATCQIP